MAELNVADLLLLEELVGFKFVDNAVGANEVDSEIIDRLLERSDYRMCRMRYPDTIVTMDLRGDRVDIHMNENGIIKSVKPC